MSTLEKDPRERVCGEEAHDRPELVPPREVPLGGPRAMRVRRTLPARGRTMVGAWCFVDHYGPDDVADTGGMVVPPHPHTALQTVSWLFQGEIEHRDSTGVHAMVVPGELNLMTAGHGVCHSEVSTSSTTVLHGVQLWTALPAEHADVEASFVHHVPGPVEVDGAVASVFLGKLGLAGTRAVSPVTTYSPLLGAEIVLHPHASLVLDLDPTFEHGVLLDRGEVRVAGEDVPTAHLLHLPPGRDTLELASGADGARVVLLGGTPFGEEIVMWWNFVGRNHDDVVEAREQWQAELGHAEGGRFGAVDYPGDSLPAPALPHVRLRPRG
ncbi:pirin family protein [uncultured Ornithinimicrobium sp.]|uniref:pirin family protein n=1 Tax=uncultured Ornithinimicrobium sp. TaxID=259307 RepID=UPI00259875C2|nr:pirin family protein [uncultured Ornithinimicrobium sp.]